MTWTKRTPEIMTWTKRTPESSSWNRKRLGGAYLVDIHGNYIFTKSGNKIILKVAGGTLPISNWTKRIPITN